MELEKVKPEPQANWTELRLSFDPRMEHLFPPYCKPKYALQKQLPDCKFEEEKKLNNYCFYFGRTLIYR